MKNDEVSYENTDCYLMETEALKYTAHNGKIIAGLLRWTNLCAAAALAYAGVNYALEEKPVPAGVAGGLAAAHLALSARGRQKFGALKKLQQEADAVLQANPPLSVSYNNPPEVPQSLPLNDLERLGEIWRPLNLNFMQTSTILAADFAFIASRCIADPLQPIWAIMASSTALSLTFTAAKGAKREWSSTPHQDGETIFGWFIRDVKKGEVSLQLRRSPSVREYSP